MSTIQQYEPIIRIFIFVAFFVFFIALEYFLPKQKRHANMQKRWLDNIGILCIDIVLVRLIFPFASVGIAYIVTENQTGLFNHMQLSFIINLILGFLLLDCLIYWQHRLTHQIPLLWRLHKVHHTDLDMDVTTGFRFHPIEILLSMLIKISVIYLLGLHWMTVLLFEIALSTFPLFNHSNIRLNSTLNHYLIKLFVTPDMHRIHHSPIRQETDSNYSTILSIWDHLFASYTDKSQQTTEPMQQGLEQYRNFKLIRLWHLLLMPFKTDK